MNCEPVFRFFQIHFEKRNTAQSTLGRRLVYTETDGHTWEDVGEGQVAIQWKRER